MHGIYQQNCGFIAKFNIASVDEKRNFIFIRSMINEVDKLQSFRHLEHRANGTREIGYEIKRMHVPFHSHWINLQAHIWNGVDSLLFECHGCVSLCLHGAQNSNMLWYLGNNRMQNQVFYDECQKCSQYGFQLQLFVFIYRYTTRQCSHKFRFYSISGRNTLIIKINGNHETNSH